MDNKDKFRIKEAPTRVEKQPVIKSSFLGWHKNLATTWGYFSCVITYDTASGNDPGAYNVHLMRAPALDGRWLRIESRRKLLWNEAEGAFTEHDKLAVRPGRI